MEKKDNNLICFSSIELSEPEIKNKSITARVVLNKIEGEKVEFILNLKYDKNIKPEYLPLLRLAFCMPLLNYGLFTKKFKLDFPVSKADITLLKELNKVFSRDIFVNKILRSRTNYILPEFLPDEKNVKASDAEPKSVFEFKGLKDDKYVAEKMNNNSCGILSSGGKESLLTYGMLKEIGCNVYPLYVNESGGHWRTALTAYRYHKENEFNTGKVWANVDRFYGFMLDNLRFIRKDHRTQWADTYPLRLSIFPFYVFSLLPVFADKKIGNLLIGSEFDDLRIKPLQNGIEHYFGVYDQHQDYDLVMNKWYDKRIQGLYQWSALRNVSGLIVERVLVKRYPTLASLQRSCHSCHFEGKELVPCGKCSKCMGILLFLLANKVNPEIMNFKKEHILSFSKKVKPSNLRLDQDEKDQSFYLIGENGTISKVKPVEHVEQIHINKITCDIDLIPIHLRDKILKIIEIYTKGYCVLENEKWVKTNQIELLSC
jgi:hypothetical protein